MRRLLVIVSLLVGAVSIPMLLSGASADSDEELYQYAAKFVCGSNADPFALDRVQPGNYSTAVNIFNPQGHAITFIKKIALTFPPAEQAPGVVSDPLTDHLGSHEALAVDCEEIPAEFLDPAGLPPYVKGFLVIESESSLDVTAVYTAGRDDLIAEQSVVTSIDVVQVNERVVVRDTPRPPSKKKKASKKKSSKKKSKKRNKKK